MSVTPYSVLMSMLWFTIAALISTYTLRRAQKWGLVFVSAVFLLAGLRGILPLDYHGSIVIRSEKLYPMVQDFLASPICGGITTGQGLLVLWGGGGLFQLIRFLLRRIRHTRCLGRAQESNSAFTVLLREVCDELGYRGELKVSILPRISTAYQAGFMRPHILLPLEVCMLAEQDIRNMLRHELCHYLGRDLWIKTAMQIVACFLWWNPVMHLLNRNIEQLLELCCDRRACKRLPQDERLGYLDTLLRMMRGASTETAHISLSYLGNTEEAGIQQRFLLVLEDTLSKRSRLKCLAGAGVCIVLFVVSYLVILQPHTEPPTELNMFFPSDSGNNFIFQQSDGRYVFYQNGIFRGYLSGNDLRVEPYCDLQIYCENEGELK